MVYGELADPKTDLEKVEVVLLIQIALQTLDFKNMIQKLRKIVVWIML